MYEQSTEDREPYVHEAVNNVLQRLRDKRESFIELHGKYDKAMAQMLINGDNISIAHLLAESAGVLLQLNEPPAHHLCEHYTDQVNRELLRLLRVRRLIRTKQNPLFD